MTDADSPTFVTHLECSATGERHAPDRLHGLSAAGKPLLVRYDLERAARTLDRDRIAARGGLRATMFCPADTPEVNVRESVAQGAEVYRVDGLINDCGRIVAGGTETVGWFDTATLKEPYRIEGRREPGGAQRRLAEPRYARRLPDCEEETMTTPPRIHVLHENDVWTAPLLDALEARGLPYASWHLAAGGVDPHALPPDGVFYNRMSASAHTRDHRYGPELTRQVLAWLEAHGRRVVNDGRALALEIDKMAQYAALEAAGVRVPRTLAAVGREAALAMARALGETPFVLKPNRGGTGAGVQLVADTDELAAVLDDPATGQPLDGTWLVQQYVRPTEPTITRCEFIGGRFYYAVAVDTSQGFNLCPADVCSLPGERERFEVIEGFDDPLLERYAAFLAANGIEVAGIEFIRDAAGTRYTYDVNTNTNYNSAAEQRAGVSGMGRLADFLGECLAATGGVRGASAGT